MLQRGGDLLCQQLDNSSPAETVRARQSGVFLGLGATMERLVLDSESLMMDYSLISQFRNVASMQKSLKG